MGKDGVLHLKLSFTCVYLIHAKPLLPNTHATGSIDRYSPS